jgi:hypothetical protein
MIMKWEFDHEQKSTKTQYNIFYLPGREVL